MTNYKLDNLTEVIINSPIIAYNQIYNFHSLGNLYDTIKSVSEKQTISNFEVIASMETFANVYELFRPDKITKYDFYWGSIKTIDAIFTTLYRFLGSKNLRRFNKGFYYIDYGIVERIPFEKISWEILLNDIEWIISVIKKTIGREALKLYRMFDSDFLGLKYDIIDYIRLEKENKNLSIEFLDKPYRKIIIEGREVLVDNNHSLYSLEREIFKD
jgi:hypothetical protein